MENSDWLIEEFVRMTAIRLVWDDCGLAPHEDSDDWLIGEFASITRNVSKEVSSIVNEDQWLIDDFAHQVDDYYKARIGFYQALVEKWFTDTKIIEELYSLTGWSFEKVKNEKKEQ